jgi:diguanylate cyclase (GGDEF)-like protein
MDRFKLINDTLGHNIGDMLLKATGDRLVSVLRKSDTVSRMGGDEFFILAAITSTANADQIARKIIMAFHEPFIIEDKEISAKLSIGISLYPEDGKDASTLTKKADIAMYYAKESGKNQYHLYSSKDPVHS